MMDLVAQLSDVRFPPEADVSSPAALVLHLDVCLPLMPTFTRSAGFNAYENALTSGSITARICRKAALESRNIDPGFSLCKATS